MRIAMGDSLMCHRLSPTLQKFSEVEARRVVFPGAARSVANRSVASRYVRIGNASTGPGTAAIPGSVAVPARKFLQRWGYAETGMVKRFSPLSGALNIVATNLVNVSVRTIHL